MSIETLYQMSDEYLSLLNGIIFDEDLSEEDLFEQLELKRSNAIDKSKNVAAFILNHEAEIEAIKSVEKRISDNRRVKENRINWLRQYLLTNMQKLECNEIKSNDGTFTIKIHAGRESINIIDDSAIPDKFFKVKREVSRTLLGEAIKNGEDVPGAIVSKKPFLTIR